ncbi:hypothetical protein [Streptomyces sp. UNOB3_S3]|uniref:hypothetical protein n=1 Tax=Streptomyces sp. UNOB3_S3 TaxID=2871682 RepID=UPI001E49BCA8|nr:hypothetical protein [Streptomyces sp. UNOB3_S3]MCC3774234.1 hypothetical protein [Streptomyces sp. UNOB3_S3]
MAWERSDTFSRRAACGVPQGLELGNDLGFWLDAAVVHAHQLHDNAVKTFPLRQLFAVEGHRERLVRDGGREGDIRLDPLRDRTRRRPACRRVEPLHGIVQPPQRLVRPGEKPRMWGRTRGILWLSVVVRQT